MISKELRGSYLLVNLVCFLIANNNAIANNHEIIEVYQPTVLITGSNRGIGLEFVKQISSKEWQIIATTRNPESASELKKISTASNITIEKLDVTDPIEIKALADKYLGQPIDILILNAAKGPQQPTATASLKRQNFDVAASYFDTNAIGPMRVTQAFMENVKASKLKQVIVISSDSGSFIAGSQLPILSHYKASKAALNMYFHTLAFETKRRNVAVVMIHPGNVATNIETSRLPDAMPTKESVKKMLAVIDGLTIEDNGRFINFNGEKMPW
ncbi:MAG: SDR family oxidoreductase [Pseudomonadota bacterium]|nr:SDR family oxidoreductase [Pseudomonadota bacterium]